MKLISSFRSPFIYPNEYHDDSEEVDWDQFSEINHMTMNGTPQFSFERHSLFFPWVYHSLQFLFNYFLSFSFLLFFDFSVLSKNIFLMEKKKPYLTNFTDKTPWKELKIVFVIKQNSQQLIEFIWIFIYRQETFENKWFTRLIFSLMKLIAITISFSTWKQQHEWIKMISFISLSSDIQYEIDVIIVSFSYILKEKCHLCSSQQST